jgi:hypothetical protein
VGRRELNCYAHPAPDRLIPGELQIEWSLSIMVSLMISLHSAVSVSNPVWAMLTMTILLSKAALYSYNRFWGVYI